MTTKDFIQTIEDKQKISQLLVNIEIQNACELGVSQIDNEFQYEVLAFSYIDNFKTKVPDWKYYFGKYPLASSPNNVSEAQGPECLTPEVLDYWLKRSKETKIHF